MHALKLALRFAHRDFRNRYLGSFSGGAWALLQPVLQLGVYAFVSTFVFKVRIAGLTGAAGVAALFVTLWPWNAFAESLQRSASSLQDNAALLTKVPVPRIALVLAPVLASFAVSMLGYLGIVAVLSLTPVPIDLLGVPLALLAYVLLMALAAGFALLLAPLQVFVRDIAPALPQLTMLWVFLSPVFYSRDILPDAYRGALDFNPYTAFAEMFRFALFHLPPPGPRACVIAALAVAGVLALGYGVFRRLQAHVEDFL